MPVLAFILAYALNSAYAEIFRDVTLTRVDAFMHRQIFAARIAGFWVLLIDAFLLATAHIWAQIPESATHT